jgi:hypothetical protein
MDRETHRQRYGYNPTLTDVIRISFSAYTRFVLRLWCVSIVFCLGCKFIQYAQQSWYIDNEGHWMSKSEVMQVKIQNVRFNHRPITTSAISIKQVPNYGIFADLTVLENEDGCHSFSNQQIKRVARNVNGEDAILDDKSKSNLGKVSKFIMIPRGNCTFYQKIMNAQTAGFDGIIIYNKADDPARSIRISANQLEKVVTHAYYLTARDAKTILYAAKRTTSTPATISITPIEYRFPFEFNILKSFLFVFMELIVLLMTVIFSASIVLSSSLMILLIRNITILGEFRLYDTILEGSYILLDMRSDDYMPKLSPMCLNSDFPVKILTQSDFDKNSANDPNRECFTLDCCSICLDEFEIENAARILPCKHAFHTECVDPWLIKHKRLCPVCKRDVLEGKEMIIDRVHVNEETWIIYMTRKLDAVVYRLLGITIVSNEDDLV